MERQVSVDLCLANEAGVQFAIRRSAQPTWLSREERLSLTAIAAFGVRLARNTEAYFDPELALGVPLSGLLGLAGFTNGELARTSGSNPTIYRARLFARQVIPLSDAEDDIEPGMNQLGGTYAKQRFVLTAGNLSVLDLFDANQYSHDPRTQFLNWTLMTHGAYDSRLGRHYGDQPELEYRYRLDDDRPGAIRLLGFRNRALMARYDDALSLAQQTASTPSLDAVRSADHTKVGIGVNAEQALSKEVGAFSRIVWADGQTETYAFTEVDRSASFGVAAMGASWGRPLDTLGVAMAINALSASHKRVPESGGLTFFGRRSPELRLGKDRRGLLRDKCDQGPDRVGGLSDGLKPGYNADRGPVSFYALRAHLEY